MKYYNFDFQYHIYYVKLLLQLALLKSEITDCDLVFSIFRHCPPPGIHYKHSLKENLIESQFLHRQGIVNRIIIVQFIDLYVLQQGGKLYTFKSFSKILIHDLMVNVTIHEKRSVKDAGSLR